MRAALIAAVVLLLSLACEGIERPADATAEEWANAHVKAWTWAGGPAHRLPALELLTGAALECGGGTGFWMARDGRYVCVRGEARVIDWVVRLATPPHTRPENSSLCHEHLHLALWLQNGNSDTDHVGPAWATLPDCWAIVKGGV